MAAMWLLLGLIVSVKAVTQPIILENNGYSGIVVAIHRNVPEDLKLLQKIEGLLIKSSPILYTATRNRAFFKEITISIPDTWSNQAHYESFPGDFFSSAQIRIDSANPAFGNEPYTLQPGGCGEQGKYIHYTPEYVKKPISNQLHRENEHEGKRLVQEWAHLRYGVFDEFGYVGSKKYPTFMYDKEINGLSGTSCVKRFQGTAGLSAMCKFDFNEGIRNPEETINCSFIPHNIEDAASASLMFTTVVGTVVHFCDDTDDAQTKHNANAMTMQNEKCLGKSTWTVVSSHSDFKGINSNPGADDLVTKPFFRYVHAPSSKENRLVLVLDISSSMKGQPMQLLASAASRCIKDHFPDGGYLSLVSFSTRSRILAPLTQIVDGSSRDHLVRLLPKKDDNGYTAIGRGLTRAIQALRESGKKVEGSRIVLVTDGEENMAPYIIEVIPELVQEKVVVSAIAFGGKASEKLENLTTATGGRLYLFADINGTRPPSSLDYAFLEATTVQSDIEFQPVTITRDQLNARAIINERFINIERVLGKNTVFILKSPDIARLELQLLNPDGRMYTSKSKEYERDDNLQRIKIRIANAKPGLWKVTFSRKATFSPQVELSVQSDPVDPKIQPVRVRAWTSDAQLTFPASLKIFAEVKKDYIPVVKAMVKAIVTRPNAIADVVELKDDGAAPDEEKDDGIYTAHFTNFTGSGRYGVVAKVISNGQAYLKLPSQDNLNRVRRSVNIIEEEETSSELETFERVVDGGVFKLMNWTANAGDIIPPSRVTDLAMLDSNIQDDSNVATIQWTSPGNDLNSGDASILEVRASLEQSLLRTAFESCYLFTEESVLNGNLTPVASGLIQTISLKIPQKWLPKLFDQNSFSLVYFAVRASDENNNTADVSNIAWSYFSPTVVEVEESDQLYLLLMGIFGGSLIVIIITGVIFLIVRYRRKHYYKGVRV